MADKRISQLIERVDIANNDVLPIVASGASTTNKVTISTIQDWMQSNLDVGVTSVGITIGTSGNDVNVTGSPITTSGNITINIPTATATIRGLLSPTDFSTFNNKLSSVGLSMPSAFVVSNSPLTANGTIAVTGAGTVSQYIRGDGSLADFPETAGGGSSVSYYLNGSVSQGTIGGIAYYEMNKTPILGAGTDFVAIADGYLASFITDAGDPALLEIPGGNWNFETYFSASSGGGTPTFYIELYKVSGSTATLIASNSATPELIAFGTTITPYFSTLAVPQTTLALTDRLALRYYVARSGRTITLHTENSHLCQIITTFTTGLTALNGLTAQVQNFATGTSGTDFNISSTGSTHTFNLPDASASNRGAVTTGTQTFAGYKIFNGTIGVNNDLQLATVGTALNTFIKNINSTGLTSIGSNGFGFNNANNIYFSGSSKGGGVFAFSNTGTQTYTLQDASGTLAFTSQIPANIVTGTGAQGRVAYWDSTGVIKSDSLFQWNDFSKRLGIGRTPTVSLDVQGSQNISGTITAESTGGSGLRIYAGSGTNQWDMYLNGANIRFSDNTGTGSFVVDRPATFNGSVTTTFLRVSDLAGQIGEINSTNANGGYITWGTGGTTIADIGTAQQIFGTGGSGNFGINARGSRSLIFGTNNTARFTIDSTGAATFSSSVTAGSVISASATFSNFGSATSAVVGFGDSNTGFFRPAANSLSITTNGVERQIINSDGAMGFNYPILGSRSFVFRTISGRPLTLETIAPTGIHSLYLRPNDSGRHLISSNYLSGGVYLPLALSGRENDSDFVLSTSGNVGIGTTSPVGKFEIASAANTYLGAPAITFTDTAGSGNSNRWIIGNIATDFGSFNIASAPTPSSTTFTPRLTITNAGNVGIGTSSPTTYSLAGRHLEVNDAGGGYAFIHNNTTSVKAFLASSEPGGHAALYTFSNHPLLFGTGNNERMRVTSGGFLKASNDSTYSGISASYHEMRTNQNTRVVAFSNKSATLNEDNGILIQFTAASPNNTTARFIVAEDSTASRFVVYSNGNVQNQNNSYGSLSDIKLKENIEDATPKLDDLMKVKVRNYNFIGDDKKQIGVIAQELEEVFPAMIDETPDYEDVEVPQLDEEGNEVLNEEGEVVTTKERVSKGTTTKSVKYSVFVPMLIKAMQEQQEQIKSLTEQVEALKSQING